jgi:hypothetical protein
VAGNPAVCSSARNGNVEAPTLLESKRGYFVRKKLEKKLIYYILVYAGMKFRNKKKFLYVIPEYTDPFRALVCSNCRYYDNVE